MCIFDNQQQSHEAFKKIWSTWYKKYPDPVTAKRWTGGDHPGTWINNVTVAYNKELNK